MDTIKVQNSAVQRNNTINYGNQNLSDINMVVFIAGLVPVVVSTPVYMHIKDGERTGEHWVQIRRRRRALELDSEWESKKKRGWRFPQGQLINRLAGKALQMTAFLVNLVRLFLPLKGLFSGHLLFALAEWNRKDWFALWPSGSLAPISVSRHDPTIHPNVELCLRNASSPLPTDEPGNSSL